jgi:hypothetical protein
MKCILATRLLRRAKTTLAAPLAAIVVAAGHPSPAASFTEGDLYLITDDYLSFGPAVVRVDPVTGSHFLFKDLTISGGNHFRHLTYDSVRDVLVFRDSQPSSGLWYLDADGNLTQPQPGVSTPRLLAARDDGLIYTLKGASTYEYIDLSNVSHDLLGEDGLTPYVMPDSLDFDTMVYDPGTNSLVLAKADHVSPKILCADPLQTCIVRLPLDPTGTRVAGPAVGTQVNPNATNQEDRVVGTGILPSGEVLIAVDTNTNLVEDRLWLLDPRTMSTRLYAQNGGYAGAASMAAATYSAVRDEVVILDSLNHVLRWFAEADTSLVGSSVSDSLGARFDGASSHFVEIRRPAPPTGVPLVAQGAEWSVAPASPNPFRDATRISFRIPASGHVRVTVHDAAGRLVRSLSDRRFSAGAQTTAWDGRDGAGRPTATGTYFVRVRWRDSVETERVVRLR